MIQHCARCVARGQLQYLYETCGGHLRRGPGLHHVAFVVPDLAETLRADL